MKVETEIITKEDIKPSSPTPSHLRTFNLCLLDHLIPAPYAPIVLFFPSTYDTTACLSNIPKRLELLKQSLSETLTRFYPLAGKMKDEFSIECSDEGAYYVEARVNCSLSQFLSQPDLLTVNKFLPCELIPKESNTASYVTNIQINIFNCGGVAIGICISHKILDGAALSLFLKGWAGTARGCSAEEVVFPNFIASSLFPINNLWLRDASLVRLGSLFKKGKCVTRRFFFDATAIANLKAQTSSSGCVQQPTRVEVVSALLWKCFMAATKGNSGSQRPSSLTHLVNLRRRMDPALCPENSIGNLIWLAAAEQKADHEMELHGLVGKLRNAISKIDNEFIKKMQSDQQGHSVMHESLKAMGDSGTKEEVDNIGFSSWCNFGFYGVDFGWGRPIWVSSIASVASVFLNLIMLVDTRLGDGIEAWVNLDEDDVAKMVNNPELLRYASLDPSPLIC